ncbi:MAG: hypothetical protein AAFN74_24565 [Myxococcota bacterium]
MDAREVERLADLSLDGELDPEEEAQLRAELSASPESRRAFEQRSWFQAKVRDRLRESCDSSPVPNGLRNRVAARLSEEESVVRPSWRSGWMPAAAACVMIGVLSWTFDGNGLFDPEEAVDRHAKRPPPEVRALGSIAPIREFLTENLDGRIIVPQFRRARGQVRLVGARLDKLSNRDAALIMYDQRGARISLFAIPCGLHPPPMSNFDTRSIDGREVMVGRHRGYSMVTWGQGGVLYSMVSDVDSDQLVRLVSMVK